MPSVNSTGPGGPIADEEVIIDLTEKTIIDLRTLSDTIDDGEASPYEQGTMDSFICGAPHTSGTDDDG